MSRGEIKITSSKKQDAAVRWFIEKFYPQYSAPQQFFKKEFENITGVKWEELQIMHEKATKVKK